MGVLKVRESGGPWLPITGIGSGITQPAADARYVRKTGDTMTGQLTINRGPAQLELALVGDASYIGFYDTTGNIRRGYLQHGITGLYLNNEIGMLVLECGAAAGNEIQLVSGGVPMLHVVGQTKVQVDKRLDALAMHTWGTLDGQFGLTCDNGGIQTGDVFQSTKTLSGGWSTAGFLNYQSSQHAGLALHSPGIAPILHAANTYGERLRCVGNTNAAFAPMAASAFEVNSTITAKRGVRPLRDRERIVVRHPVDVDVAPLPDVMALRPVAFRPLVPTLRIVPTEGEYETVNPHDPTTWRNEPWGDDTVFGREGNRERLGLIAEEVQYVIPSAVSHDVDGNAMGIDYAQITVALLDHVQRLTDEISTLRYRVAELERTP